MPKFMDGREKCEFLRKIRVNIAMLNGLDYTPSECHHGGWCSGTCPACEKEADNLIRQLQSKEAAGCSIKIDVESIKVLEQMARESEDIDDDSIPPDTCGYMMPVPYEEDDGSASEDEQSLISNAEAQRR